MCTSLGCVQVDKFQNSTSVYTCVALPDLLHCLAAGLCLERLFLLQLRHTTYREAVRIAFVFFFFFNPDKDDNVVGGGGVLSDHDDKRVLVHVSSFS